MFGSSRGKLQRLVGDPFWETCTFRRQSVSELRNP
jgi:hypothetical protein